jgi:F0F1-type ATP synthase membrane subunit b/b'
MSIAVLLSTGAVYADNHSAGHATPEVNWWGLGSAWSAAPAMGWLFITFVIFVWVLARAIKKPLALYLETRSNDIRKAIEEGQKAKLESEQKLRTYEEKLKTLDQEIGKMKAAFEEQAAAEAQLKESMTKEASARILKDTQDTINASFERSKNKLAAEVINTAMSKAQSVIVKSHLSEVDSSLKNSLVDDMKSYAHAKDA